MVDVHLAPTRDKVRVRGGRLTVACHSVHPRGRVTIVVFAPEPDEVVVNLRLATVVIEGLTQPAVVEDRGVEVAVLVGDAVFGSPRVELHVFFLVAPEVAVEEMFKLI